MTFEDFQPWLERWGLTPDGEPFVTDWNSKLAPVRKDGAPAMLKIAPAEEERRGGRLMAWYGGDGAAQVLAIDETAVLLERLTPVRSLADMARAGMDDEASVILVETAARLHAPRRSPPPADLMPLPEWFGALWPSAAKRGGVLALSAAAARALLADPRERVVLHGDLHHGNVLDGGPRGWLAIDPKALIGERGFDHANMLCNPDARTALAPGRLARQAGVIATAAGLDRARLMRWLLAYAGLSASWTLDSGGDASPALALAELAARALGS